MKYWLVITSYANFSLDREKLGFKLQGVPFRFRKTVQKMEPGDKVVYYIMGIQKFGAIAIIAGKYFDDKTKIWSDNDELWPSRCSSKPEIVLEDDELVDAKKLIDNLSFITNKEFWGTFFQGSIREIPEDDFKFIESEIRKVVSDRTHLTPLPERTIIQFEQPQTEKEFEDAIMKLPLESKSLHDRIGEMLEQIGSWMDYNSQQRHKIIRDHAYELDVAWLSGKNPEIAIEIQISGNLTEAKDRLAQARKFNYRKVIMVLKSNDVDRFNKLMRYDPEMRNWMDIWSIGAVYKMYIAGENFFRYFGILKESVYKEKKELELIQ